MIANPKIAILGYGYYHDGMVYPWSWKDVKDSCDCCKRRVPGRGHHRIGDRYEIESETPQGMCLSARGAIFPYVMAFFYGGGINLTDEPLKEKIHCPDPNGIVLEVEKVKGS